MQRTFSALILAAVARLSLADLPVHCVRHQVAGNWEFTLSPMKSKRSACGHRKPDNPLQQPHMQLLEKHGPLRKLKVTLDEPDTASSEDGAKGTWNMVYDEGFEVAMGDLVYFAFSKFTFTDGEMGQNNISHCGETQIGWYRDSSRSRWGCYVGRKIDADAEETVGPTQPPKAVAAPAAPTPVAGDRKKSSLAQTDQSMLAPDQDDASRGVTSFDAPAVATSAGAASLEQNQPVTPATLQDLFTEPPEYKPWIPTSAGYDKPMEGNWQQSVATALNFMQLGWKAKAHDQFKGKTPRELNKFAGVRRSRVKAEKTFHFRDSGSLKESFTSFLGMTSRVHRSSYEGESFDWRNKDGKNWLGPVESQGDCGSCYAVSTIHMLTSRNKIRAGSTSEPSFSISFPLFCSEYNQGCDGGYGFLLSKWSEDVGLVPAKCLPDSEQSTGSCKVLPGCDLGKQRYRVTNHQYVGGFPGAADAEAIRRELVEKGPLVLSFEPKEDFMYYKSGVYRSGPQKIHQEWEQVDHAVLGMGYGMDGNQAYWTLQNSWGTDWGEDGYFRMARGIDESSIEYIPQAAEVVQETSNKVLDEFIAAL